MNGRDGMNALAIDAGPPQGDRCPVLQEGGRDAAKRLAWGRP
jgi:hypothetical protein